MSRVLSFITGRWFLSFVGAAALCLIVWFLGPLTSLLEGDLVRLLIVAAILLVWLIVNLLLELRAARRNDQMIEKIAEPQAEDAGAMADRTADEEVGLLKERLQEALAVLKKSRADGKQGRQYLYELPWYILIGPPGSGKTTALINSGLKFPLANQFGQDPLRGVGGTRYCDWWFCDEAILLDTAGRYTTQDSDEAVDKKAWRGFLGLLKTFRPRQPINGALVAVGLSDLLRMSPVERSQHARAIRSRVAELQGELGLRFPVYVLLTKLDMIAGFVEFFDDLRREEREQVWGMTFPLEIGKEGQGDTIAAFDAQWDALIERLNARLLERVQEERDPGRRALVFGFPAQIALLKQPLHEFFQEIFAPSRFEERALVRGFYLTSATQEGTPIDRLMSAMAATYGIEDQRSSAFSGTGRSYFLTRLLRDVIFGESSLVGTDPRVERRQRWVRRIAWAAIGMVALALIAAWTLSYIGNSALIAEESKKAADFAEAVKPLDQPTVSDDDIAPILPLLDQLRALPAGYDSAQSGPPLGRTFGLDQSGKLESEAVPAYRRALNFLLLPRLLIAAQTELKNNLNKPNGVEVLLDLYRSLGGQLLPPNKDFIKLFVANRWRGLAYSGLTPEGSAKRLADHVDALLEQPLTQIPLDANLVIQATNIVANTPLEARAYGRIQTGQAALALPPWRIVDHAGPAVGQVFARATQGKLLSDGIPGFYTYDGFHKVLVPGLPAAIKAEVEQSNRALGPQNAIQLTPSVLAALVDRAIDLYDKDFMSQWDQLLSDVTIVPFRDAASAAEIVNTLSGPVSPLKKFLMAASDETSMNRAPAPGSGDVAAAVSGQAASVLNSVAAAAGVGSPQLSGKPIDDHFKPLHDLTAGAANGQSQLDAVIMNLANLYAQLRQQAGNPALGAPGTAPGGGAATQLALQASRLPAPLGAIVGKVAGGTSNIAIGDQRKAIQDLYVSTVLPFCKQALDGRYPTVKSSQTEVAIGDFTQLFRPGGVIDSFFTANLKPYVDDRVSPWKNQKVDNVDLALSPATLAQFERARIIRDSFFPGGGPLTAEFTVTPQKLSPNATQALLDVDGQALTYAQGPIVPQKMQWPAANPTGRVRLVFTGTNGDSPSLNTEGPWAWFRLLDQAKIDGSLPDQFTIAFSQGGLSASFQVRAASVRNPFRARDIEQFRCPAQL